MPISPERVGLYPADWPVISARIRERAGDRCEWCGAPNLATIYYDQAGQWHEHGSDEGMVLWRTGAKGVRVVLTVAHLDHDPTNCDDSNLAALCQRCHLRYDTREHTRHAAETRRQRREAAGQGVLL